MVAPQVCNYNTACSIIVYNIVTDKWSSLIYSLKPDIHMWYFPDCACTCVREKGEGKCEELGPMSVLVPGGGVECYDVTLQEVYN